METSLSLIAAIRSGQLSKVQAELDAGAGAELNDGEGEPGLPMGVACFMGCVDIVRELAKRGARVNVADNDAPTTPLNMAIRGGRTEVVRALLELGAEPTPTMQTGLSEHEIILAQWQAQRAGRRPPPSVVADEDPQVIEEIEMQRCIGTDTQLLEADALRALENTR